MKQFPLGRSDIFLDIVDYDQRKSGLPGNVVQLIMYMDRVPDEARLRREVARHADSWHAGLFLQKKLFKPALWETAPECRCKHGEFHIAWHRIPVAGSRPESVESVLDEIINRPLDLEKPPVFMLDVVEYGKMACICFTWHHLLTDARGGEMLFRTIAGAGNGSRVRQTSGTAVLHERNPDFLSSIRLAKKFKPMVRRMKELGVKSPASGRPVRDLKLKSIYRVLTSEHTERFSSKARSVHPLFGETATLMAASLRAVHFLMPPEKKNPGGYIVPVPLSRRQAAMAFQDAWMPGNRISICFIPVEAVSVEKLDPVALAYLIASEFREQVASGLPEAAEAAMDVARFFPRALYRWILRDSMDGELSSFFFSNTGTVCIGGPAGETFNVAGAEVTACFHRPMVSCPPGIGFFFSTYNSCLHFTTCWLDGAIERHEAEAAASGIIECLECVTGDATLQGDESGHACF